MNFTPRPAPTSKRVLAGLVDGAVVLVLCAVTFIAPLLLKGTVLPMWGVLLVLIGWAVVPLAAFKKTFGLSVAGLEVVTKTGHALDLANALFRELLGRGWFPAAYVFTVLAGLVASYFGVGASVAPPVLMGVMFVACSAALTVALVGHVIALGRPDGRSLADLMSGSFVVLAPALPEPTDPDERADAKERRARVTRNVVLVELVLVALVAVAPLVGGLKTSESPDAKVRRLKIEALQAKFAKAQNSESLSNELQSLLLQAGREAEAREVANQHRTARSLDAAAREESLRADFTEHHDRASAQRLIQLLEEEDRVAEARDVYAEWLGPDAAADELVGFGNWLATNNLTDEAVEVLTRATTREPLVPLGHTLLGVCLQRMGRLPDARDELTLALLDDPEDADARDALDAVVGTIGPLSTHDEQRLGARFKAWARDAGR